MAEEEAAPAEETEGEEAPKKKKLSGKVLILFILLPLLLLGGGGGAAMFLLGGGEEKPPQAAKAEGKKDGEAEADKEKTAEAEKEAKEEEHAAKEEESKGDEKADAKGKAPEMPEVGRVNVAAADLIFFELPDMLVNLNSSGSQPRFLKIRVELEFGDEKIVKKLRKVMPRIIDHFQVYLRELRREDLRGSAGMYRLKEELMIRVNQSVEPMQIRDVLFKEMLVQ